MISYYAAETCLEKFNKSLTDEHLATEQMHNSSETSPNWWYLPWKIALTPQKSAPSGFKDSKGRLLAYSNAAGTQKLRLLVIGTSRNPCTLKVLEEFFQSHIRTGSMQAWFTRPVFLNWFESHFVHEVRAHWTSPGLASDAKFMLILDNCSVLQCRIPCLR